MVADRKTATGPENGVEHAQCGRNALPEALKAQGPETELPGNSERRLRRTPRPMGTERTCRTKQRQRTQRLLHLDHGPTNGVAAPTGGDCRHSGLNTPEAYL